MHIFKRLSATVSRSANRVMPNALTAAQETLKMAQAAQLPICAPAINVALEILNIIQTVKEATAASIELLQTMHVYDETIANMVEIMSPTYLESSGDAQARIARKSIEDFESTMASIKETLDKTINQKTWKKALNNSQMRSEMEACSRRLAAAREQFNSSTMMVILANTCTGPIQGAEIDDFRIPGATPLGSQDIKLGPLVLKQNSMSLPTFWADVRVATVRSRKKLVKLYPSKDGGEEAFLQDMKILTKNLWPNLPAVFGYSRHSSVPFIVFENSCVERFGRYLKTLVSTEPNTAITKVRRMLVNLRNAANFLIKNEPEMDGRVIRAAFMNPFVDENCEIILAPQSEFTGHSKIVKQRTENLNPNRLVLTYWAGNCLDGRFCPLRNLGLALMGEAGAALGLDHETPSSPESLSKLLHRHWPQTENRLPTWFLDSQSHCSPADLGVFISQDDSVSFRRLGSVADALGSVADALGGGNIHFQDGLYVERMADDIVRFTFDPLGDDPVRDCVTEKGMYLLWKNKLSHHFNTWNYLVQNASKFAHQYGAIPEELVLSESPIE